MEKKASLELLASNFIQRAILPVLTFILSADVEISIPLAVPLRDTPTMSSFTYAVFDTSGSGGNSTATPTVRKFLPEYMILCITTDAASVTNGQTAVMTSSSGSTFVIDSEL